MEASNEAPSAPPRLEAAPRILDLSPSDESEPAELLPYPAPPNVQPPRSGRCPSDMVDVAGMFCIDRYEVSLVDVTQGRRVSPHYPPTHRRSRDLYDRWRRKQAEATTTLGRSLEVPAPPSFQLEGVFSVKAVSEPHTVPNGYLSRLTADQACRNAGKRLCSRETGRCCERLAARPAVRVVGATTLSSTWSGTWTNGSPTREESSWAASFRERRGRAATRPFPLTAPNTSTTAWVPVAVGIRRRELVEVHAS